MTLIIIQGQGYYLACPKCSAIITPPQGSPIPDPARLQGKVCPACEDAPKPSKTFLTTEQESS